MELSYMLRNRYTFFTLSLMLTLFLGCSSEGDDVLDSEQSMTDQDPTDTDNGDDDTETEDNDNTEGTTGNFANIDFSRWKITLPVDENNDGSPDEYQPNELSNLGYQDLNAVQPFMYDDEADASIVFHAIPATSTVNSSFSRSELRELLNPSTSRENWTLEEGGFMTGRLKMENISIDNTTSREFHRTIIMQIHGIVSVEDVARLGLSSNSAPPLIKMYWEDGNVWVFKKSLVDEFTSGDDLYTSSNDVWFDEKINMGFVGYEPFNLSIRASDARLEIQLNNDEAIVFEDTSLDKWPFENYYKAGNYLQTSQEGAFATLKYYNLTVTH